MTLDALSSATEAFAKTARMPVMFVGHGNPMNAIVDSDFSRKWQELGRTLPHPAAILSISAHWLTSNGTKVTAMDKPKTIHDFGGFPDALFAVQYPAPGAPALAAQTQELVATPHVGLDQDWGLDHGTWSVLVRMYPDAAIPVYQLSIDYGQPMHFHHALGMQLQKLRDRGVLIMGSGNVVHNLREFEMGAKPFDWAVEFDKHIADGITSGNDQSILDFQKLGALAKKAHPTYDHLLPLLYVLGAKTPHDKFSFFNEAIDAGSVAMRSVVYG